MSDDRQETYTQFRDRIDPYIELYDTLEDYEGFGRLMIAYYKYSANGEVTEFKDPRMNVDFQQLMAMDDRVKIGHVDYIANQTIKSNLRYASSESDMRERLEKKGLSEEQIDEGVYRYRMKFNKDNGLNENGQAKSWDAVDKWLGTDYSKR